MILSQPQRQDIFDSLSSEIVKIESSLRGDKKKMDALSRRISRLKMELRFMELYQLYVGLSPDALLRCEMKVKKLSEDESQYNLYLRDYENSLFRLSEFQSQLYDLVSSDDVVTDSDVDILLNSFPAVSQTSSVLLKKMESDISDAGSEVSIMAFFKPVLRYVAFIGLAIFGFIFLFIVVVLAISAFESGSGKEGSRGHESLTISGPRDALVSSLDSSAFRDIGDRFDSVDLTSSGEVSQALQSVLPDIQREINQNSESGSQLTDDFIIASAVLLVDSGMSPGDSLRASQSALLDTGIQSTTPSRDLLLKLDRSFQSMLRDRYRSGDLIAQPSDLPDADFYEFVVFVDDRYEELLYSSADVSLLSFGSYEGISLISVSQLPLSVDDLGLTSESLSIFESSSDLSPLSLSVNDSDLYFTLSVSSALGGFDSPDLQLFWPSGSGDWISYEEYRNDDLYVPLYFSSKDSLEYGTNDLLKQKIASFVAFHGHSQGGDMSLQIRVVADGYVSNDVLLEIR